MSYKNSYFKSRSNPRRGDRIRSLTDLHAYLPLYRSKGAGIIKVVVPLAASGNKRAVYSSRNKNIISQVVPINQVPPYSTSNVFIGPKGPFIGPLLRSQRAAGFTSPLRRSGSIAQRTDSLRGARIAQFFSSKKNVRYSNFDRARLAHPSTKYNSPPLFSLTPKKRKGSHRSPPPRPKKLKYGKFYRNTDPFVGVGKLTRSVASNFYRDPLGSSKLGISLVGGKLPFLSQIESLINSKP